VIFDEADSVTALLDLPSVKLACFLENNYSNTNTT